MTQHFYVLVNILEKLLQYIGKSGNYFFSKRIAELGHISARKYNTAGKKNALK